MKYATLGLVLALCACVVGSYFIGRNNGRAQLENTLSAETIRTAGARERLVEENRTAALVADDTAILDWLLRHRARAN
jgi:hypothetical protein